MTKTFPLNCRRSVCLTFLIQSRDYARPDRIQGWPGLPNRFAKDTSAPYWIILRPNNRESIASAVSVTSSLEWDTLSTRRTV